MNRKYELTDVTTTVDGGRKLYRIRALRSFGRVSVGDLGGYIEEESNLSHDGNCWVADNAKVYDKSVVSGNAIVKNNAVVHGYCRVRDYAIVEDNAQIYGCCDLSESTVIGGNVILREDVDCTADTFINGDITLFGIKRIYGRYVYEINPETNRTSSYYIMGDKLVPAVTINKKLAFVNKGAWTRNPVAVLHPHRWCCISIFILLMLYLNMA